MSKKQNKTVIFHPDERCIGGRNQITDLIFNHQLSIINAKPQIESYNLNSIKLKGKKNIYSEIYQFKEVFESFRRVANVKYSNFTAPPKTFNFSKKHNKNSAKKEKFLLDQHQLNLESQNKRISNLKNMNMRKKNEFDYIAYPSLFFRRNEKNKNFNSYYKNNSIIDNEEIPNERNEKIEKNQNKSNYEESDKIEKNDFFEENTEKNFLQKQKKIEKNSNEYEGLIPIPEIKGKNKEDYKELKEKLIELIYEYTIFKNEDLESLFGRTLLYNKHMDKNRLEQIFKEIIEEFENE